MRESITSLPDRIGPFLALHWRILLIIAIGLVLRLINLNGRPLWYDETFSILFAEQTVSEMLDGTVTQVDGRAAEEHPILFYATLRAWMTLFGNSPAGARLYSAVLGTLTVWVGFLLGQRLFGQAAGLGTAGLVALAPFHIYYSQEVRMYALLALATMSLTYFFVRAWTESGWHNWLAVSLSGALALYAHNLGILYVAALDFWILWRWIRDQRLDQIRGALLSHLLMAAIFTPWLSFLPGQLDKLQQYWITRPGFIEIIQTLLVFHFAYDNQALPTWLLTVAFAASAFIPAILILELVRRRRGPAPDFPQAVSLLLFLSLGPPGIAFLISQARPIYVIRALLPSALAYYVLLAGVLVAGIAPKPVRWGFILGATGIALFSLGNHYTYEAFPRSPFQDAALFLQAHADPTTDGIVHSNKLSFFPTYYYGRLITQQFIADEPGSPSDTLADATQAALGLFAAPDLATAAGTRERIWFVIFDRAVDEFEGAGRPHPHLAWLSEHYVQVGTNNFGDLSLFLFTRRSESIPETGASFS